MLAPILLALAMLTPAQAREAALPAIVKASRLDSCVFTDAFFNYTAAPFQKRWHEAWSKPSARVVQWSPIEHGKTQRVTGWLLHRLGNDPWNTRVLWVGASQQAGKKSTGIIKQAIEEQSPFLRACFPHLKPGPVKWTQSQFSVQGAKLTEKDCSVETAGLETAILGGRFNVIVLDDICSMKTTLTADTRDKVTKLVKSTILGRLLPGGVLICLGNAWYPDDVMHVLEESGFTVIRDEAYREAPDGRIVPGSILWPEQWPLERLGEYPDSLNPDGTPAKRRELGTVEALRQLRCVPYSAGQGRFKLEWFDRAMSAGSNLVLLDDEDHYRGEYGPAFLGVDLGVSQKEGADKTAFWAMGVNAKNRRTLLNAFEDRLTGPDILARLELWNRKLSPSTMVENNAAQDFIRQFASAAGIPTRAFTTGKQKADPAFGVPSLGNELEQDLWVLPTGDERSAAIAIRWRTQCLAYSPGQHTGDLLMASWFARESARLGQPGGGGTTKPEGLRAAYGPPRANYGGRGRG